MTAGGNGPMTEDTCRTCGRPVVPVPQVWGLYQHRRDSYRGVAPLHGAEPAVDA